MYAKLPFSSKFIHIFPIIPVYFIIFEVTFTIWKYIIFSNSTAFQHKLTSILLFVPSSTMVIITHIKSMFTSPGYVPIPYTPPKQITIEQNPKRPEIFCNKCNNPRPPRSHHCKICDKCTLRMDHHCKWIANCVGYKNQKFFYQFLFYASFGNIIAFIILFFRLCNIDYKIETYIPKGIKITNVFQLIIYMWEPIQLFIGCICAFAMVIGIGKIFHKQTIMLLNNQTTIDAKMFPKWEESPYYNNDKKRNFNYIMGNNIIEWFTLSFKEEAYEDIISSQGSNYINLNELV